MNNEKIRYRITFEKKCAARFVGHLDLQTLFHRALKRAGLPVAYSKGFNPHMLISFAQPLPLGMESLCEMVDVEMTREVLPYEIIGRLNESLPNGLNITNAKLLHAQAKRVAAAVYAAEYDVVFDILCHSYDPECFKHSITDAVAYILKGNEPYISITEKIINMSFIPEELIIRMTLCAGGEKNLKPAIAVSAVCEQAGIELTTGLVKYTRTGILLKT